MHIYTVISRGINGEEKTEQILALNPGHAFAKCNGVPLRCFRAGRYRDGFGMTEWEAPSLIKVEPLPEEKFEQTKFKF